MATLDLFKRRQPHTIYLDVDGEKKAYNIPTQYTAEDVERILEIQVQVDDIKAKAADEGSVETQQDIKHFWQLIYSQLRILFQHYHPECEMDWLKQYVPKGDALDIIAFHTSEHIKNVNEDAVTSKKKATKMT